MEAQTKSVALTPTASLFRAYSERLHQVIDAADFDAIGGLAEELMDCWRTGRRVFLCGNGGSAANANHIANDLIYGISKAFGSGLRIEALTANASVVTCLANDEGYDRVFSYQLGVKAKPNDVLIVLSGSGNSPNILKALETAREMGVRSYALLGYSGGRAKTLADHPIHFEIDDMQIAEDMQLVVAHMIMQWLYENRAYAAAPEEK